MTQLFLSESALPFRRAVVADENERWPPRECGRGNLRTENAALVESFAAGIGSVEV
jgi:hypothetical protein